LQEVWLDGEKLTLPPKRAFGELLTLLETQHLEDGRIIRSIAFDGQELEDFRSEEATSRAIDAGERVEVATIDWKQYLRETVEGAPRHVEQIGRVLAESISLYRQNLPAEGAKRLHSALIGIDVIMKLIASLASIGACDVERLPGGGDTKGLEFLGEVLTRIVRCQESGDSDGLARTLENDLVPQLATWGAFLEDSRATLEEVVSQA
jgi:hypothetical protein